MEDVNRFMQKILNLVLNIEFVYCAFQYRADSKIQSSTEKYIFHYRQSNVQQPLPTAQHCFVVWTVLCELGSSRKLGGATKHLIDGSKTHICQLSFEF